MNAILPFLLYSGASIALTVILAMTLYRNGKVFLAEVFDDNHAVAQAINNLLVTGFFMINLGYAFLISRMEETPSTYEATVTLMSRLGVLLFSLGIMHFINLMVIWKIRKNLTRKSISNVPLPPTHRVQPPPPSPGATPLPAPPAPAAAFAAAAPAAAPFNPSL